MSLSIGSNSFQLNNVYVIPSMRKNLLSIAQLFYDNNVLCAFDSQHFYIFDHSNGSLLFQGLCKNVSTSFHLFRLIFRVYLLLFSHHLYGTVA